MSKKSFWWDKLKLVMKPTLFFASSIYSLLWIGCSIVLLVHMKIDVLRVLTDAQKLQYITDLIFASLMTQLIHLHMRLDKDEPLNERRLRLLCKLSVVVDVSFWTFLYFMSRFCLLSLSDLKMFGIVCVGPLLLFQAVHFKCDK